MASICNPLYTFAVVEVKETPNSCSMLYGAEFAAHLFLYIFIHCRIEVDWTET